MKINEDTGFTEIEFFLNCGRNGDVNCAVTNGQDEGFCPFWDNENCLYYKHDKESKNHAQHMIRFCQDHIAGRTSEEVFKGYILAMAYTICGIAPDHVGLMLNSAHMSKIQEKINKINEMEIIE